LLRAQVGDKYVLELMQQRNATLGGEQSGHIIDLTVHTTGDGIHTALIFGEILSGLSKKFSALHTFDPMPQLLVNQEVASKPPLDSLPRYQEAAKKAHEQLGARGRILVRYSGTENLVRVMVEGEDEAQIKKVAEDLRDILRSEIG
jgi:phosphoglucosamine mutase